MPIRNGEFDEVWQRYIKPLKGQVVPTAAGKQNLIVDVTDDCLMRQSSTGNENKIGKQVFRTIFYRLKEKKSIARDEIHKMFSSERASAIHHGRPGQGTVYHSSRETENHPCIEPITQ